MNLGQLFRFNQIAIIKIKGMIKMGSQSQAYQLKARRSLLLQNLINLLLLWPWPRIVMIKINRKILELGKQRSLYRKNSINSLRLLLQPKIVANKIMMDFLSQNCPKEELRNQLKPLINMPPLQLFLNKIKDHQLKTKSH